MENAIVVMTAIVATDLQKPVNNVSKNVLLTKKTKMESYYVGSVPCPTRGPWFEPSNQTLPDIVEFSKLKKTRKRKKKKKETNISITKNLKDLM